MTITLMIWVIKKSAFMRWFGYGSYPTPVADEFTYVWQAISLKRNGVPMAWTLNSGVYQDQKFDSRKGDVDGFGIKVDNKLMNLGNFKNDSRPLSAVKEIDYIKGKEQMLFVAPFFDHPPLGGMIYSWGVDKNIKEVEDVKSVDFRRPALTMAIVTTILLFIFLTLISSKPGYGLLGSVIYGTAPTYLLASRTAFLENVVPPLVLINLILLWLYKKNIHKKWAIGLLIGSGIFAGLAVLAKEPGIGFVVGGVILLWINRIKIKNIFIFLVSAGLPIIFYLIWGWCLQGPLFWDILMTNASRGYFGAIKITTMLETLKFKNFPTDGWWIWGILSFVLVSIKIKNKNILFLIVPLLTHLLVVLLLGSGNYPWYWISAIPFLAGCGAWVIGELFEKPKLVTGLLFFFIPFSSSYYWGREALGIGPDINHYRKALLIFALLLFCRLKIKDSKFMKIIWMIFMAWLIYKVVIFSEVFMPYLISHWGNLSIVSLPNY